MKLLVIIGIIFIDFSESKFLDNSEHTLNNILENVSNLTMSNSSKKFDTLKFRAETNKVIFPNGTEFESSTTSINLSNYTVLNKLSGKSFNNVFQKSKYRFNELPSCLPSLKYL